MSRESRRLDADVRGAGCLTCLSWKDHRLATCPTKSSSDLMEDCSVYSSPMDDDDEGASLLCTALWSKPRLFEGDFVWTVLRADSRNRRAQSRPDRAMPAVGPGLIRSCQAV